MARYAVGEEPPRPEPLSDANEKARHTGRALRLQVASLGGHTCTSMTTLYRPIPGSTTLRNQYTAICAGHTSIDVHMRPVSQRQARNAACNSSS